VKISGRQTMGVRLMNLAPGDSVVAVARNAEAGPDTEADEGETDAETGAGPEDPAAPEADMDSSPDAGQDTDGGPARPQEGDG
jgi:hypothetical protein